MDCNFFEEMEYVLIDFYQFITSGAHKMLIEFAI